MKNFILGALLLTSFSAFAENSHFSVSHIGNSCAPWDGHAISFHFKDNADKNKSINISIWRWDPLFPFQTKFKFSSNSNVGSMNMCFVKDGKPQCELQDGYIMLNKPYKTFKVGDFVEGDVVLEKPASVNLHFKYTIPENKPGSAPQLCG